MSTEQKTNVELANLQLHDQALNEFANKVIDGLEKLYEKKEQSSKRWIWELIQNAKDAADNLQPLNIEVVIEEDKVVFSHSGKPFTIKNIQNLIYQTSMKDRSNEETGHIAGSTGKFGTGFITTHLLSKFVEINSVYYNVEELTFQRFKLVLDRTPSNRDDLMDKLKQTCNIFQELDEQKETHRLLSYEVGVSFDTSFTYDLEKNKEEGAATANEGMEVLSSSIYYVLLFNEKINSLKTIKNQEEIIYKKMCVKELNNGVKLIELSRNEKTHIYASYGEDAYTSVAFEVQKITDQNAHQDQYKIIKKDFGKPTLFADFPLIGSEKFPFPCYLNSHKFWPNEERSFILLENSKHAATNQELILQGVRSFFHIFKVAHSLNWQNISNLCYLGPYEFSNKPWYEENVAKPITSFITSQRVIEGVKQSFSINEVSFLDLSNASSDMGISEKFDLLWDLLVFDHIIERKIVQKDHNYMMGWQKVIDNQWEQWKQYLTQKPFRYSIEDLLKLIDLKQNLDTLTAYFMMNDESTIKWLQKLYNFLHRACTRQERDNFNQTYAFYLNQNKRFVKYENINLDMGIEEQYKQLCFKYQFNIKERLLSLSLQTPKNFFPQAQQLLPDFVEEELFKALNSQPSLLEQVQADRRDQLALDIISYLPSYLRIENDDQFKDYLVEQHAFHDWIFVSKIKEVPCKMIVTFHSQRLQLQCREICLNYLTSWICTYCVAFQNISSYLKPTMEAIPWMKELYAYCCKSKDAQTHFSRKIMVNENQQFVFLIAPSTTQYTYTSIFGVNSQGPQRGIFQKIADTFPQSLSESHRQSLSVGQNGYQADIEMLTKFYAFFIDSSYKNKLILKDFSELPFQTPQLNLVSYFTFPGACGELDSQISKTIGSDKNLILKHAEMLKNFDKFNRDAFQLTTGQREHHFPLYKEARKKIMMEVRLQGDIKDSIYNFFENDSEQQLKEIGYFSPTQMRLLKEFVNLLMKVNSVQSAERAWNALRLSYSDDINPDLSVSQALDTCEVEESKSSKQVEELGQSDYSQFQQFLMANCITSLEELKEVCTQIPTMLNKLYVSSPKYIAHHADGFSKVKKAIRRSMNRVMDRLEDEEYDSSNKEYYPGCRAENIIIGLSKNRKPVVVLVKPSDKNSIQFLKDVEQNALNEHGVEVWTDDGKNVKLMTVANLIKNNTSNQFIVVEQ